MKPPVYYNDKYDFWALSRFEDIERARREPQRYSSAHTTVLEMMTEEAQRDGSMIFLDPPEHTLLRRLVSKAFTPRRVAQLEGEIRELCASLLDAQQGRDSFDYVQDFGARLPATVIAALLGVPPADREDVRHHIDRMFHLEPEVGMANDVAAQAGAWLYNYIGTQLEECQTHARDDMFTDLVQAELTDQSGVTRRITPQEGTGFGVLLIAAGTETVARLLGWAALLLAGHPEQQAELAQDSSLIPNAVEELLRYEIAVTRTRSVADRGSRAPRQGDPRRFEGAAADRFSWARRADLPRRRPFRHPAGNPPARCVRVRHSLLSRSDAGAHGRQDRAGRDLQALQELDGRRGGRRPAAHEHRAGLPAAPDSRRELTRRDPRQARGRNRSVRADLSTFPARVRGRQSTSQDAPTRVRRPSCSKTCPGAMPSRKPREPIPPGLAHGDYRFDNVVLDRQFKVAGVLDWELCTIGNPIADFAWSLEYWSSSDDPISFLADPPTASDIFVSRDEVIRRYGARSGFDLGDLAYYRVFSWWKQACIVEGVHARYLDAQRRGRPLANDPSAIARRVDTLLEHAAELASGRL
jgi:hypothetical protein